MSNHIRTAIKKSVAKAQKGGRPSVADSRIQDQEKAFEDVGVISTHLLRHINACVWERWISIVAKAIGACIAIILVCIVFFKMWSFVHKTDTSVFLKLDPHVQIALVASSFLFCLGILGITLRGIYSWGKREKDEDGILPENYKVLSEVLLNLKELGHH